MTTLIKAIDQIALTDITDNYSVNLSKDSYVFTGTTESGTPGGSGVNCSTVISVFRGGDQIVNPASEPAIFSVATVPASYSDSVITATISGDGKASTPYTLTVGIKSDQTLSVSKEIPMLVTIDLGNSDTIEINKIFTVTTTKKGPDGTSVTVTGTHTYYGYCASGTDYTQVPSTGSGAWAEGTIPSVPNGQYLWTKTVVSYSGGSSTTTYSVSYVAEDGTSQYLFIRYAPTGDTSLSDMTTTPQSGTKYVGIAVVTTNSAPTTKSSYTWSEYVGEDGANGFSVWTTTTAPSSSKIDISKLTGPTGVTPRVGEHIIRSNRYQYTITAVSSTQVTVGAATDLKGTNGTSVVWKGDLSSAPSNPQTLWAYYNTIDKKSYIYNGSSWDTMTNDGSDATQYYYHVVYCNNTSTGAGYSTTGGDQLYTGTYTDTTQADAATWSALPSGVKWNYSKGPDGDDGYSVATVNVYKCVATKPNKPYYSTSGDITYTFSTNSFNPTLDNGWSLSYPSVGSGNPVWKSTINLSGQNDTITINKNNFSDPVVDADETQAVYISANPDTFESNDGGKTYSPNSVVLTPRFINTTYYKWYYINSGGTEVDLTSSTPSGISINSGVLTITKAAVSDLASGSAVFKNYKSITFKCVAYIGNSSSNTKVSDYYTIVKLKDGIGISSKETKYAQSSSGTTPPSNSSDWKDTIALVGTIPPGNFLWTRTKFIYSDDTSSDYIYTSTQEGLTGKGITSVTPLHYLCGPIIEGYKSGSKFYEDENHTKEITPVTNYYYYDKTSGQNKYYKWNGSSYGSAITNLPPAVAPSAPAAHVTSTSTNPNIWTIAVPKYVTNGKYYICEEIAYDDNTYSWSTPILDNSVTDAYIEIDKQQGEINMISENVVNLEHSVSNTGASVTFDKDCYIGSLHRLEIAPTASSGSGSIFNLYPSDTLYPSTTLYPKEQTILTVQCSGDYNNKYQYYLDIDKLNYTDSTHYDKFIYEDGKCYIERINGNIEERNKLIPVNSTITVGGEDIQVSDSVIYLPVKSGISLKLLNANYTNGASDSFKYEATYLIDNVYTSNFSSNVDLVSQINMTPGNIKIKANNIQLEGYTTINGNFKVDEEGNMECHNGKFSGDIELSDGSSILGGNGLITSIIIESNIKSKSFIGGTMMLPMGYSKLYDTYGSQGITGTYTAKDNLLFEFTMPRGFIVKSAYITLYHMPIEYKESGILMYTGNSRNLKLYKADTNNIGGKFAWDIQYFDVNFENVSFTEIPSAFGINGFTGSRTDFTQQQSINIKDYITTSNNDNVFNILKIETGNALVTSEADLYQQSGACKATLVIFGYTKFE